MKKGDNYIFSKFFKKDLNFIRALPKTDLHCHIDGSIPPSTILELAISDGIQIPSDNLDEFTKHVSVGEDCKSLDDFLEKFHYPLKVFSSKENIERITLDVIKESSKSGVKYLELRFAPLLGSSITTPEEKIEAVLKGIEKGKDQYDIDSNLILCCMRHSSLSDSFSVVDLAQKYKENGVVAIDLAGSETQFPPELHKEAFQKAKKLGLKITVHAGETGIHDNVEKSLDLLHADRIGHGTASSFNPALIKRLKDEKIPLEVCIKSNLDTKAVTDLESHPIKTFIEKGLNITLNTDDSTVSNITLMDEYERLLKVGIPMKNIVKIIKNGINSSFAPDMIKEKMLREVNQKEKEYLKNKIKNHSAPSVQGVRTKE